MWQGLSFVMTRSIEFDIRSANQTTPSDTELEALLWRVYVDGGFTSSELAKTTLAAASVRERGDLLVAFDRDSQKLIGTIILVPHHSLAARFAEDTESEIHLLAVAPEFRRQGVGRALVEAALDRARELECTAVYLWTQGTMAAAHRIYESVGFHRQPKLDFERNGRSFVVMVVEF